MISFLLMQKVLSLALILVLATAVVKIGWMKAEDSRQISAAIIYLIMPAVNIAAFQIECTPEITQGLLLALGGTAMIYALILFVILPIMRRLFHISNIDQCSILFTNCTNLLVPVVNSVLGSEWVIYTFAFAMVQNFSLWSYGYSKLSGQQGVQFKKIFCNVNMISLLVGAFMFFAGIRIPALVLDTCNSLSAALGPLSMIVAGMLLGGTKINLASLPPLRFWLVFIARMFLVPLATIALFLFTGYADLIPAGRDVLLVTMLAAAAPAASMVTQMVQVYGGDSEYANLFNVLTTVTCILTLPLMTSIYLAI